MSNNGYKMIALKSQVAALLLRIGLKLEFQIRLLKKFSVDIGEDESVKIEPITLSF